MFSLIESPCVCKRLQRHHHAITIMIIIIIDLLFQVVLAFNPCRAPPAINKQLEPSVLSMTLKQNIPKDLKLLFQRYKLKKCKRNLFQIICKCTSALRGDKTSKTCMTQQIDEAEWTENDASEYSPRSKSIT